MAIIKELEPRPDLTVPLDYEDRVMDLAIEAIHDIAECDGSIIYIKWEKRLPQAGGIVPLLYVLFADTIVARDGSKLKKLHLAPDGRLYPAHAICLASLPNRVLLEGQKLKDVVRKGVEDFLRLYNVAISPIDPGQPLRLSNA